MTCLDIHLTGLDGFGQITGEVFAFWWDGNALKKMLQDSLTPTDPWPSWRVRVSSASLREFASANANHAQDRREEFNTAINALLNDSVQIEVLIQEA